MKDLKQVVAEIEATVPKSTHRTVYGAPWFTSETGADISVNLISEDEMRRHGLEIGDRKAKARREETKMKTEHEIAMEILYDRLRADVAAKKQYAIDQEAKKHNTWLTWARERERIARRRTEE